MSTPTPSKWVAIPMQAIIPAYTITGVLSLPTGLAVLISAAFTGSWIAVASGGALLWFGNACVRKFFDSARAGSMQTATERLAMIVSNLGGRADA